MLHRHQAKQYINNNKMNKYIKTKKRAFRIWGMVNQEMVFSALCFPNFRNNVLSEFELLGHLANMFSIIEKTQLDSWKRSV